MRSLVALRRCASIVASGLVALEDRRVGETGRGGSLAPCADGPAEEWQGGRLRPDSGARRTPHLHGDGEEGAARRRGGEGAAALWARPPRRGWPPPPREAGAPG